MSKKCRHEPDCDTVGIATCWKDFWVSVSCRHCGEYGCAVIDFEDFRWNDDDDPPEDDASPPQVGTETPSDSSGVSEPPWTTD
jgi:hypothetical protein